MSLTFFEGSDRDEFPLPVSGRTFYTDCIIVISVCETNWLLDQARITSVE
jgi:hypothetical protein